MDKIKFILGIFFCLFVAAGCTTYHQLKPVTPNLSVVTVTTLTPKIVWEQAKGVDITYDIIIYDVIRQGVNDVAGSTVYYRENISGKSHVVEEPLEWDKTYFWSVRIREGEKVREWSRYDFSAYLVFTYVRVRNQLFKIQPITQAKLDKQILENY